MIRRILGPFSLALLVGLAAAPAPAAAAGSDDPFEGLDAIRLSASVGGPLDLRGGTERELFAGDLRRFNHFVLELTTALDSKLATCGLFVTDEAADELSVELFGRREELRQCAPHYVFMIQVRIFNSKSKASRGQAEWIALRPVIGLAEEAALERTLIDATVATVAAELRNCDR